MSRRFPRIKNTKHFVVRGFTNLQTDAGLKLITPQLVNVPTLPTAVGTLSVVSTSASDTTGAGKKVVVDYLDTNWQERRAVFSINGTTAVTQDDTTATISAIRINRVVCMWPNVGRIDVLIGATTLHQVAIDQQESGTFMYTVPVGQQAVAHGMFFSCKEACNVRLRLHSAGDTVAQNFKTIRTFNAVGTLYVPFGYPKRIEYETVTAGTWEETKLTLIADALCLTTAVTAHIELGLDLEITRTDMSAVGFRA